MLSNNNYSIPNRSRPHWHAYVEPKYAAARVTFASVAAPTATRRC